VSYSLILDWDAQVFWISKTLNFYNNENIGNLVNSRNENYPFLGSLLWATFWKISFISEEYTGRLFYVFLYSVSLASLIETLKSTPVIKSIFFIILVLMSYKYVHFSGSQDVLIFCLIAIAAKNLYCIIDEEGNLTIKQLVLLLLICNSLIWTKQEGTVYAFIIMFTVLFYSKSILYKKIFLFGFIGFLFALRIFIHKTYNLDISINTNVWSDFSLNSITDKMSFDRMLLITKFFIYSFFKNLLFMMGLVFFIISLFSKVINKKDLYIYFFYIMSYGFIFIAYIATDADLAWMLKVGMDRLIYSASPLYILIIIKYINAQTIKI